MLDGQTIAHGQQVNAYSAKSVPFGQSCSPVARTCNNGVLSGSGSYLSCAPAQPKDCTVNGVTFSHGETHKFFAAASVPYGQSCSAEVRTCNNGVASGSYTANSCSVAPGASCTFNGKTVAHGASVTAYTAKSVPNGQVCSSIAQTRTCTNGSLSGSAPYDACTVEGLVSSGVTVTFRCSISAANSQSLRVTYGGTTKQWDFGNGERSVAAFTFEFPSAPTAFQAFSNGSLSSHRYTNQSAHSLNFTSEDGNDGDYNDLVCAMTW
jgi:hypothetical protein